MASPGVEMVKIKNTMDIKKVETRPFTDQKPGTSGLRKKVSVFQQAHYVENFAQAIFNALSAEGQRIEGQTLVVGGDGRFYNREAIQKIIAVAAGNGFGKILVAQNGILSTPAASCVIRKQQCMGGIILSASHNPGGPEGDFGMKYNISTGSPAPEKLTKKIYEESLKIQEYFEAELDLINLSKLGLVRAGSTNIVIFDGLNDYVELMQTLFDFKSIQGLLESGFKIKFDAMQAVTGPYAKKIFVQMLGADPANILNAEPKEDFGGGHPDPNLVYAEELVKIQFGPQAADFGAASDGDGDRNMILGKNFFVSPGDSLAMIAEHLAECAPGYKAGLKGLARSMPTSSAVDRVAKALSIPCYETPTGWKFFGNLMDAGLCTVCGEESFGTGSDHVREKDGLWAVLAWLSILAKTRLSVQQIAENHWQRFGRSYFARHDYEALEAGKAAEMMREALFIFPRLVEQQIGNARVISTDDFCYEDPTDKSFSKNQGLRIFLDNGARIVMRLSGTGTEGATLRLYFEQYSKTDLNQNPSEFLKPLFTWTRNFLKIKERFGRTEPDVIT